MAYEVVHPRFEDAWIIYADTGETVSDIESALPDAPVGSQIILAVANSTPKKFMKFPSDWVAQQAST